MPDSDQVLSQAEIDVMLNGGGGDSPAAVEAPPACPPPPVAQETVPAPLAPSSAAGLGQDDVQGLFQRIAALEESVQRLSSQAAPNLDQSFQQLFGDLQAINSKVDGVTETLQATVGFGVRSVFACKSCEAQGHVATRLTCTSCGTEEWWGWFPPAE